MAYTTFAVAGNATARGTIAPTLTTAGFVRVTQDYSPAANFLIDVWRSPAAVNAAGVDWYLIIGDLISGANRGAYMSAVEGWDDATKLATRYVPVTNNVAPAADFSIGAAGVAPTIANVFYCATNVWANAAGQGGGAITASPDRVVLKWGDPGNGVFYMGHMDRTYPTSIDPVQPLGVLQLYALDGAANATRGGCTREPAQTLASSLNWRAQLNSGTNAFSAGSRMVMSFTDSILNRPFGSPCAINAARFYNASWRATLKGVRVGTSAATAGDVMTETQLDGTTKSYWLAQTNNPAVWVEAA